MIMERLREGSGGLPMKILLGAIAISFIFVGGAGTMSAFNSGNYAVKVNGKEVSTTEFNRIYQQAYQRQQQQLGQLFDSLFTPGGAYEQQFKKSVIQNIVNNQLIEQYADHLNLRASAKQIIEQIVKNPAFFDDKGKFDNDRYQQLLRQNGITPTEYAESLRNGITNDQLTMQLQKSTFTLPFELTNLHRIDAQQRQVRLLTLTVASAKKEVMDSQSKLSDADRTKIETAYYNDHHDQFMNDERYNIEYLVLNANDIKTDTPITDADISDFYQKNKQRYVTKESRKLNYIITVGHTDASLKKIQAAKAMLATSSFADVAKTYSDEKMSDLGWIEPGVMGETIDKALAPLTIVGAHSDIVKTEQGYQLFNITGYKASGMKSIEQAKADIIVEIKKQHSLDAFATQHETLSETALNSDDLDAPAKMVDGVVKSTGLITLDQLPAVLKDPKVSAMLKDPGVQNKNNSPVIDLSDEKALVIHLKEYKPKAVAPYEEVKDKISEALIDQLTEKKLTKEATDIITSLDKGDKLDNTYKFSDDKMLTRTDTDKELVTLAFTMKRPTDKKPTYNKTLLANGDMIIVALDKVVDGSGAISDKETQYQEILSRKEVNSEYSTLMRELHSEAKIQYQASLLAPATK